MSDNKEDFDELYGYAMDRCKELEQHGIHVDSTAPDDTGMHFMVTYRAGPFESRVQSLRFAEEVYASLEDQDIPGTALSAKLQGFAERAEGHHQLFTQLQDVCKELCDELCADGSGNALKVIAALRNVVMLAEGVVETEAVHGGAGALQHTTALQELKTALKDIPNGLRQS